ncbi:MAG: hypothetical protein ABJA82_18835, partial [Myxococcales bacterium]
MGTIPSSWLAMWSLGGGGFRRQAHQGRRRVAAAAIQLGAGEMVAQPHLGVKHLAYAGVKALDV